jgi:hypothetical protein
MAEWTPAAAPGGAWTPLTPAGGAWAVEAAGTTVVWSGTFDDATLFDDGTGVTDYGPIAFGPVG